MQNIKQIISQKNVNKNINRIKGKCKNITHIAVCYDYKIVCGKCKKIVCNNSMTKNGCIMCIYPNIFSEYELRCYMCINFQSYWTCYNCAKLIRNCGWYHSCHDNNNRFPLKYKDDKMLCSECAD